MCRSKIKNCFHGVYAFICCTSTVTLSSMGVVAADADAVGTAAPVGLLFDLIEVPDALLLALDPRRELPRNKRLNNSLEFK